MRCEHHATAATVSSVTRPEHPAAPAHEVHLLDGRFMSAECSCGWRTAARRSRAVVRVEARDHALLYADGRALAPELAPEPAPAAQRTSADA